MGYLCELICQFLKISKFQNDFPESRHISIQNAFLAQLHHESLTSIYRTITNPPQIQMISPKHCSLKRNLPSISAHLPSNFTKCSKILLIINLAIMGLSNKK